MPNDTFKRYAEPFRGLSATGNLVEVIGEEILEEDGELLDCYVYNIVGYKPKNGKPFVALKCNIHILS